MIRDWGRSIGGPNAITVWSWIVALPLALVIGVSGGLILGIPLQQWLIAVVVTQVVLIVPLVLARTTYLSARPRAPRPLMALVTFAILGALRAVILVGVARLLGAEPAPDVIAGWVIAGVCYGVAVLSATAIVVDGVREHRSALNRLRALSASIEASRALDESRQVELADLFLDEVQAAVTVALDSVRASAGTRAEVSAALRSVAEDVVRPLSHRLADETTWRIRAAEAEPASWAERARELLSAVRPARPLLPVLVIETLAVPFLLQSYGPAFTAVNLTVGSTMLFGLCWVIAAAAGRVRMALPRLLGLAAAYAIAGAVAALGISLVAAALGMSVPFFWTTAVYLPVVALAAGLLSAVDVRRAAIEAETVDALAEEAQAAARLHESLGRVRRRLSRVLHSTVQGEFIAAALTLAAREEDNDAAVDEDLERLGRAVAERIRFDEEPSPRTEDRVRDLISLWDGVLTVELNVDSRVWTLLDSAHTGAPTSSMAASRSAPDAVVDLIAEGLTNAVRHGSGTDVIVRMDCDDHRLDVTISSPGSLGPVAKPGLGLVSVAEAADVWTLAQSHDRVELAVSLQIT